MESILLSVKDFIGPTVDNTDFDTSIIVQINTALSILTQLGVGPPEGFSVEGEFETWSDFMKDDPRLNMVKTFVQLKAKLIFDPPSNSSILESYNQTIKEIESRITYIDMDSTPNR